jgi:hypothetical protein
MKFGRDRKNLALALLAAATIGFALGALPNLCHAEDEACESNPLHHAAANCGCSCHMAVVLPSAGLGPGAAAAGAAESAPVHPSDLVYLSQPVPPPRG